MGKTFPKQYFPTPKDMERKWRQYKKHCDTQTIQKGVLDKDGNVVIREYPAPITYTILGFSLYVGMTDDNFHITYARDPEFKEIVELIRRECEFDCRTKFEKGIINSKLAGLWLGRYGYTTKQETEIKGGMPVVIHDDIK